MKKVGDSFELSATDLVGHLHCRRLTVLDRAVAEGALAKPKVWDPVLQILAERGGAHEQGYIEHLTKAGLDVARIDGFEVTNEAAAATLAAMRRGVPIIVQGALSDQGWKGRADVLHRVEMPSALGGWSYEAIDTKLARGTKAGTILQLCLYSDLLTKAQGLPPESMYVVAPWSEFEPQQYRFADYAAYFRKVKRALLAAMAEPAADNTYPNPIEHCEICRWRHACDQRRRDDDHLCLVAGISKLQINELKAQGIATVHSLAGMPLPLNWKPNRGSADSYIRIREQARIVVEARAAGAGKFELLPVEVGFGLTRLPEPSDGDVFLDLEGDPFVGEHGLEYLFGYLFKDAQGASVYEADWALSRTDEKRAFETLVDFIMARWAQFPGLHIYHYASYEPAALKRLMGRHATREEEIDRMLRAGLFVDLYHVVRHGLRASVESYSIKRLEPFYEFERGTPLDDANVALANLQANLELGDVPSVSDDTKATVRAYNEDDCRSASALRDWLESQRAKRITDGVDVPRPQPGDGAPNEKITDWLIKINAVISRLTADVPDDPVERDEDQQARWILANVLDWHRREEKAVWWEYFRLAALSSEELLDERAGLSGLIFVAAVDGTAKAPIHRYRFPPQETEIRGGEELRNVGGAKLGKVEAISLLPLLTNNNFATWRSSRHPSDAERPQLRLRFVPPVALPDFKVPLPRNVSWLVTTEVGGWDCVGSPQDMAHTANNYFSVDFSWRNKDGSGNQVYDSPANGANIPIRPAADGVVVETNITKPNVPNGLYVVISHDPLGRADIGFSTRYLHLKKVFVKVGDKVSRDTSTLGFMGSTGQDAEGHPTSTGPHLHFGIRYNNRGTAHSEVMYAIVSGWLMKSFQTECLGATPIRYYLSK